MRTLTILLAICAIINAYRVTLCFLKKQSLKRKIYELLIMLIIIILCYYNMHYTFKWHYIFSVIFIIYILSIFIYEKIFKKETISTLSIKDAIDLSPAGIMFLNSDGETYLINSAMSKILNELNIHNNYLKELSNISIYENDNYFIIKVCDKVWQFRERNNNEITAIEITDLYLLKEEEEKQNKELLENNIKIRESIKNIENLEKEKNLLKIKNEYHDRLGHRLAILTKYLDSDKCNKQDIKFLISNIYEEEKESKHLLDNLVKMYKIIGININIDGNMSEDENTSLILFEVIREAVTNAIIHADSKNIFVKINDKEMVITNDGLLPKKDIYENEGLRGMRRKLSKIDGSLFIDTSKGFTLKVTYKN